MSRLTQSAFIVAVTLALAGCDATETKLENTAPVSVRLALGGGGAAKASADGPLVLNGTDGTLSISDVRFILDEFSVSALHDGCEKETCNPLYEGKTMVDVPLDLESLELFAAEVPLGSYSAVRFAINGLGPDDAELAAEIRTDFPNWPDAASIVIVGLFSPADDSPDRPFTIYFGADVDVSVVLDPPLELEEEHIEKVLTLGVDLLEWLPTQVEHDLDISGYDYDATGEVIPFVFELDKTFTVESSDK